MGWAVAGQILAGEIAVNDFFAHWVAARFIRTHAAIGLYDFDGLHAFQQELTAGVVKKLPFPYPPAMLFLLAPFGKPTVIGHLLARGYTADSAHLAQLVVAVVVGGLAVIAFRRRGALGRAAVLAGAPASAGYAFLYDLPMTTDAVLALRLAGPGRWVDAAVAAAGLMMPAVMTLTTRFTWTGFVCLAGLTAAIAARALSSGGAGRPDDPGS